MTPQEEAKNAAEAAFAAVKEALASAPLMAARVGDKTSCPKVEQVIPHVGGPIAGPGCATVMIGNKPASVQDDQAGCVGPPDKITAGSTTVMIGNKAAVRLKDPTEHGGIVSMGEPTVIIGG